MQGFPQELSDLVLDHVLSGDDLRTCGLVCQRWLPRSRFHLFSTTRLDGFRLESFLDLDRVASIPLFPLIRQLTLHFYEELPFESEHMLKLRDCVNLICIRIYTPTQAYQNCPSFRWFLNTYIPLLGTRCVSLSRFDWIPVYDTISVRTIADILTSLPALEAFQLNGPSTVTPEDVSSSHSFPERFHTLELMVKDGVDVLFHWFLSLPALPLLSSLILSDDSGPPGPSLTDYCQRAGTALESLYVWHAKSIPGSSVLLKHATHLRHLTLYGEPVGRVPTTISTVASSDLSTLHIHASISYDEHDFVDYSAVPYALIDKALSDRSLERFSMQAYDYYRGAYISLLTSDAESLMPLAHARGILDCTIR
ncbi:hypothetical protein B0H11DRAFT_365902 [Mycena galericulata]|nr:hypothetical protein B0H11DRAFT_365902 [Mycena galericulata]